MVRSPLIRAIVLILIIIIVLNSLAECKATGKKRAIIFDLPHLNLTELSGDYPNRDYPNLMKLVSTGSIGLVIVPGSSSKKVFNSISLRLISQIPRKNSTEAVVINKNNSHLEWPSEIIVVDGDSIIDLENISSNTYLQIPILNTVIKNDPEAILKIYRHVREQAKIIVITLTRNYKNFSGADEEDYHQKALRYYDFLIGRISAEIDFNNTLLLVCSSSAKKHKTVNAALTSIIFKGLSFESGVLYSPSTRKKGLITYNDLRQTIAKFLNSETQTVFQIKNTSGDWRALTREQNGLAQNYAFRWPLLTGYVYLLLGVILLMALGLIIRFHQSIINWLIWIYIYLLTVPGVFLLEALVDPLNWTSIAIYTLIFSGALFLSAYIISQRNIMQTLSWIAVFTAGLVMIDGLVNGCYEYKSFLGYSVITGARYYGIGNEYMGILLGSYITGVSLILQKTGCAYARREYLWLATCFIGLILLHPDFGADVGGGITALTGLGLTNYLWLKQPVRLQEISRLILMTLVALTFAGTWDLFTNHNSMSHLGQFLMSIKNNGAGAFVTMASRKIKLNIRLICNSPLTMVLIGTIFTIPFLLRNPKGLIKRFMEKYPKIGAGLTGLSITALIGLLTNDSGIVSAAMVFMFGFGMLIAVIDAEGSISKNNTAIKTRIESTKNISKKARK